MLAPEANFKFLTVDEPQGSGERDPGQPECPALQRLLRVLGVLLFASSTCVSNSAFIFLGYSCFSFPQLTVYCRGGIRHVQKKFKVQKFQVQSSSKLQSKLTSDIDNIYLRICPKRRRYKVTKSFLKENKHM